MGRNNLQELLAWGVYPTLAVLKRNIPISYISTRVGR